MRCERCRFENMPGETTCFRCQAPLEAIAPAELRPTPAELTPPRAGRAKRFRGIRYGLNRMLGLRHRELPGASAPQAPFRAPIKREQLIAAGASVVPGLGHLLTRKTRRIFLLWPAWFVALWLGLILYGTLPGWLFIGAAAALHAWIVCDAGALRDRVADRRGRILIVLAAFGLLLFGVYGGARLAAGTLLRGVCAPRDDPEDDIRAGDFLLVAARVLCDGAPRRGEIILYRTRAELRGPGYAVLRGDTVGKILAMPGERVVWRGGKISVCRGQQVLNVLSSPAEFAAVDLDLDVPANRYFCIPPDVATALGERGKSIVGAAALAAYVRMMGFADASDVKGRAVMVYEPLWRRGIIPRGPVEPAVAE